MKQTASLETGQTGALNPLDCYLVASERSREIDQALSHLTWLLFDCMEFFLR